MSEPWLDFARIRRVVRFETVLERYGLRLVRRGAYRFILCPFHKEKTPSCTINLTERRFYCFGCGAGGTVIDFVARMERLSIRDAAMRLSRTWELTAASSEAATQENREAPAESVSDIAVNPPLGYTLDLDPEHPYLKARGYASETIRHFGIGYCRDGLMRGRICFPIHDLDGHLVGYSGRWASDPVPRGVSRYLVTPGFRKSAVLYNLNRVAGATQIVLVEGFWSVLRLHELAAPAVALMGTSISTEQIQLLRRHGVKSITLLMDGDESGYRALARLADKLSAMFPVHAAKVPQGEKPDVLEVKRLIEL